MDFELQNLLFGKLVILLSKNDLEVDLHLGF